MKYVVGIMLTSFGTFFAGEGIGVQWWREDLSLLPLIVAYGLASVILVQLLKRTPSHGARGQNGVVRFLRTAVLELWGLFVDDGALAVVAVLVLFAIAWYTDHVTGQRGVAAVLLVVGVLAAIVIGLVGPYRKHAAAVRALPAPEPAAADPTLVPEKTLVG
jgi:hypothetical protein